MWEIPWNFGNVFSLPLASSHSNNGDFMLLVIWGKSWATPIMIRIRRGVDKTVLIIHDHEAVTRVGFVTPLLQVSDQWKYYSELAIILRTILNISSSTEHQLDTVVATYYSSIFSLATLSALPMSVVHNWRPKPTFSLRQRCREAWHLGFFQNKKN